MFDDDLINKNKGKGTLARPVVDGGVLFVCRELFVVLLINDR